MRPELGWGFGALVFILGAGLSTAWPGGALGPGGSTDLMLLISLLIASFASPRAGVFLGFAAGLVAGGLAGADMGPLIVSRAIPCFALGFLPQRDANVQLSTRLILVVIAYAAAQFILMFLAPPADIGAFLRVTMAGAMINAALAWPMAALLQRWFTRRFL
ncbi:MAG: hypothetical protein KF812_00855 [Fimbriimonadaceae bacterium]|nr:hypothetical protein [Fimbriimonadaceae bacterium]